MSKAKKFIGRKVEIFLCTETVNDLGVPRGFLPAPGKRSPILDALWVSTSMDKLKKGDIFRVSDVQDDGLERPDEVVKGQPAVYVATTDGYPLPPPPLSGRNVFVRGNAENVNGFLVAGFHKAPNRKKKASPEEK